MSTITMILEPQADGTLHLPIPAGMGQTPIRVRAELEAVEPGQPERAQAGAWKDLPGPFWMAEDFNAPLEDFRDYME